MPQKSLLDRVEVASPCSENWNEMQGGNKIRFCESCEQNIHNISAMTRSEVKKLVAESKSKKICVRLVRQTDGSVETAIRKSHQITARRASRIAASVFSATVALSAVTNAQNTSKIGKIGVNQPQTNRNKIHSNHATSQISFTVEDPAEAAIAGAQITLTNQKTSKEIMLSTGNDGNAQFYNLERGRYKLDIEGTAGFNPIKGRFIEIQNAVEPNIKMTLSVGNFVGIIISTDYEYPLLQAIVQNDVKEVQRLIASKAKINVKDNGYDERTALHVAVETGNAVIVRMLLDAGAKVNAKTKLKETPLLLIDEDATPELVKLLIEHGADVDAQDEEGKTALMKAADEDKLEIVKMLLEAGANPNLKDKDDETALDNAFEEETKTLLKSYGAREN